MNEVCRQMRIRSSRPSRFRRQYVASLNTWMAEWILNGKPVAESDIAGYAGFVYLITDLDTGMRYVGRKYLTSKRKTKTGRRKTTESNWKDYYGSSASLAEEVKLRGPERFRREILSLHKTRGDCNAAELRVLWMLRAHERPDFYNRTIGTRYGAPEHVVQARVESDVLLDLEREACGLK